MRPKAALGSPRIPIVVTQERVGRLRFRQEAWAGAPRAPEVEEWSRQRVDYLWLTVDNDGPQAENARIIVDLRSRREYAIAFSNLAVVDPQDPGRAFCVMSPPCARGENRPTRKGHHLRLIYERLVPPGEDFQALLTFWRGREALAQTRVEDARHERDLAVQHWTALKLPYDRILLPDPAAQALLESSIRNIYQSRELRNGRPVFQVGPTCYRSTWALDGPFLLEAVTYLGRASEARQGLHVQLEGEGGPGGVTFSKKAGLRLWMIWRHAQLTGDRTWLETMWPQVQAEVERIVTYRQMTREEPGQVNCGLMPAGFGDGGLGGLHREYTNVYWTLAGLRVAGEIAACLGKPEARNWRAEYQDYWRTFDRARQRDKLIDEFGNMYIPVTMKGEQKQLPQRGAWAFLHAVFPGCLFRDADALMLGTMAVLDAHQSEGLILGTGWLESGIWTYAGSLYAQAHLWLGHGRKAAETLYAFANHACPLLCWREEQSPGGGGPYVGDMPHNWASAEYIRLIRHLLILERGKELHLLAGLAKAWTVPGARTQLTEIPTSFGVMSLSLAIAEDGGSAQVLVDLPARDPVQKLVLHLEHFQCPVRAVLVNQKPLKGHTVLVPTHMPLAIQVRFEP